MSLFAVLLILLFLGFAVTQGIGNPSVSAGDVAVVEGVPEEISTISEAEFERALARYAEQGGAQSAPGPGDERYEELKAAALGELLDAIWIQGEAEELGIAVTSRDIDRLARLQVLSAKIRERVLDAAPDPSDEEIVDYYKAAKATQLTTTSSRDVRVITNTSKAKLQEALEQLRADSSPGSWRRVGGEYSEDPLAGDTGGLQQGLTEDLLPEPLKAAIFQAPPGEPIGPLGDRGRFLVFEVVEDRPEGAKSLGEVRSSISAQLRQRAQEQHLDRFIADYEGKWTSRTFCAEGFVIERCANYVGDGHPATASPACYEAEPEEPAIACPAPVAQAQPALPGSVSPLEPEGRRLPQRPRPSPSP